MIALHYPPSAICTKSDDQKQRQLHQVSSDFEVYTLTRVLTPIEMARV